MRKNEMTTFIFFWRFGLLFVFLLEFAVQRHNMLLIGYEQYNE